MDTGVMLGLLGLCLRSINIGHLGNFKGASFKGSRTMLFMTGENMNII